MSLLRSGHKFNNGITGFGEDREYVNDNACPGRLSMSITEAVKKVILDNRRIPIRDVAADVGINFYGCFRQEMCGSKDCSKIAKF